MSQLTDLTRTWGYRWDERRWHYRRSLASRVTLLTTMAVGLSVAFVALGAYATVRVQMTQALDDSLLERAHRAAESTALSELISIELPSTALGAADIRIALITAAGDVRTADDLPAIELGGPERDVWAGRQTSSVRTLTAGTESYRVVAVQAAGGQALVLAQSLEPQNRVLQELGSVMTIFGFAGVITAALAGWIVALNGLRPVRKLTEAVEVIARTEDLRPLTVEGDDEIARLAIAFNSMLTALSASRDRQRQLVADAGHELRTPLTSLRTNLDLLAQADSSGVDPADPHRPRSSLPPQARRELLHDVRAQIEELTTLIGDLVELARDEPIAHVVEEIDLADVVDRAVARVRRRAPSAAFDVHASSWWVYGEPTALERAVTNLLDNAAKWGPLTGTVTVRLEHGTLTVDDEGPGIAAKDLPHVFERFYRSEESRAMPGSGLGLSIVAQVAERHAGSVRAARSPSGGARVSMTLPGSPRAPKTPRAQPSQPAVTEKPPARTG
jgi:two-component system, OmpR family, sensor histidine kinase MprB